MAPETLQWMQNSTTDEAFTPCPKPSGDDPDRKKEPVFKSQNGQKTERSCDECSSAHRACIGQRPHRCQYCEQVGKSCSYEREPQTNDTTSPPPATEERTSPPPSPPTTTQPAASQPNPAQPTTYQLNPSQAAVTHVEEESRKEYSQPVANLADHLESPHTGVHPPFPTTSSQPYQPQSPQNPYPHQVPVSVPLPVYGPMSAYPGTTHEQYATGAIHFQPYGQEGHAQANNPAQPYTLPEPFGNLNGNNEHVSAPTQYPPFDDDGPDGY